MDNGYDLESVWWEALKSGKIKDFRPFVYLVGKIKKWRDEKFICLAKKKNERIKNKISINLQLCFL